jgi:ribosomal protein L11 methyltransferase
MAACKLVWAGPRAELEAAELALSELLYPPAPAVSLTRDDDAADDGAAAWRLEAYFAQAPDMAAIAAALKDVSALSAPQIEALPDIDWVAHSLEGLGIVRAGRFVLYGAHDADRLPNETGDIPIRIDANQAFGTGHHPTTAGCLELLDRLGGLPPQSILDLGTGSAALAIAAAKLWRRPVLAADIDAKSVEIARENATLNGVGDLVEAIASDGFAHRRIAAAAPFDFIFANILAGPLMELAPQMAAHVGPRGRALIAGLMSDQEPDVAAAFAAAGFRRLNRLDHPTWPVLLFVRM